jgi:ABC-type multidrug transport system fused ATPase/permease subunit
MYIEGTHYDAAIDDAKRVVRRDRPDRRRRRKPAKALDKKRRRRPNRSAFGDRLDAKAAVVLAIASLLMLASGTLLGIGALGADNDVLEVLFAVGTIVAMLVALKAAGVPVTNLSSLLRESRESIEALGAIVEALRLRDEEDEDEDKPKDQSKPTDESKPKDESRLVGLVPDEGRLVASAGRGWRSVFAADLEVPAVALPEFRSPDPYVPLWLGAPTQMDWVDGSRWRQSLVCQGEWSIAGPPSAPGGHRRST